MLQKIAETEKIDIDEDDINDEIYDIAEHADRRVASQGAGPVRAAKTCSRRWPPRSSNASAARPDPRAVRSTKTTTSQGSGRRLRRAQTSKARSRTRPLPEEKPGESAEAKKSRDVEEQSADVTLLQRGPIGGLSHWARGLRWPSIQISLLSRLLASAIDSVQSAGYRRAKNFTCGGEAPSAFVESLQTNVHLHFSRWRSAASTPANSAAICSSSGNLWVPTPDVVYVSPENDRALRRRTRLSSSRRIPTGDLRMPDARLSP